MNPVEQNAVAEEGSDKQIEWEMRPGGMLVQRRENGGDEDGGPLIKIKVSYGSSLHEFTVPWQSTFGISYWVLAFFIDFLPYPM